MRRFGKWGGGWYCRGSTANVDATLPLAQHRAELARASGPGEREGESGCECVGDIEINRGQRGAAAPGTGSGSRALLDRVGWRHEC